jgi:hypothetical protein
MLRLRAYSDEVKRTCRCRTIRPSLRTTFTTCSHEAVVRPDHAHHHHRYYHHVDSLRRPLSAERNRFTLNSFQNLRYFDDTSANMMYSSTVYVRCVLQHSVFLLPQSRSASLRMRVLIPAVDGLPTPYLGFPQTVPRWLRRGTHSGDVWILTSDGRLEPHALMFLLALAIIELLGLPPRAAMVKVKKPRDHVNVSRDC